MKNKLKRIKYKYHRNINVKKGRPSKKATKVQIAFTLIFISLLAYGVAFTTYKDLASASTVVYENPSWDARVSETREKSEDIVAPVDTETDGVVATKGVEEVEKLLKAICTVESNCNSDRIGDGGHSYGAFQIYLPAHPNVTKEQAMDFEWAKEWTLNHCKKYIGHFPTFAKCHNGIGKTTNQWYVDKVMKVYNQM